MKSSKLEERLRASDFKLKSLLDITREINSNASTDKLLQKYRDIVEGQLGIPRLVYFTCTDGNWQCALQYGLTQDFCDIDVPTYFGNITEVTSLISDKNLDYQGLDLIMPVLHQDHPVAYLLIGDIDDNTVLVSPIIKHQRVIQTLTNFISVAIENKVLMAKSIEQERTRVELELAAEMQALMVGSGKKDYQHFEVATYYKPHQQVGGDFCEFFELDNDEVILCVADVSGKGVSAAFLMANVQAYLQALIKYTDWTLESILYELNEKVVDTVHGDRFVTLFLAHFNYATRTLEYINAGHSPPVLLNDGKTQLLEKGTVGIGMLSKLPFINKGKLTLSKNAILLCYTDGVVEIENDKCEEFGYDRIGETMLAQSAHTSHADDLIAHILNAMDNHKGSNDYFDDTALLCCRFK